MPERYYQVALIKKLRRIFPGSLILKNDSGYLQGVPDIIILYGDRWAMLEVKDSLASPFQPNQEYYLDLLDRMSFASVICPDNEEEVLGDLQQTLRPSRTARASKR